MSIELKRLVDPVPEEIGNDVYEFLAFLGGPTEIFLSGKNSCRTRAFVTLLHGNEPSGLIALFRWLKSGKQPAVNIVCFVGSVHAALEPPVFSHRVIDGQRDLNRCFRAPFDDAPGLLARKILDRLEAIEPESLIDMHNTSGTGPSFGVAIYMDEQHDALTALFTQRLIVTHLRLGALMEVTEYLCPTVTVECGGRLDDSAHNLAFTGLNQYFLNDQVLRAAQHDLGLEILNNPVRLELREKIEISFNERPALASDVTLLPSIEHLNSGVTPADTFLGWVNSDTVQSLFVSTNSLDNCVVDELVYVKNGGLYTRRALKLFMTTNDAEIAKMDCLFYAVRSDGREVIPEV